MKVLVIDTALNACTAAVFEDDRPLGVRSEPMAKGHQERIGGLVRDAVADAGGSGAAGFDGIERIGVTVGPGSFTGLRVGLAFAQGLGAALGVPVVGISTLAALARSKRDALAHSERTVFNIAAVIDARRGQVYLQTFHDDVAVAEPQALAIDGACESLLRGGAWSLVGSGAPLIVEAGLRHMPVPPPDSRTAMPEASVADLITVPTPAALAALTIAADPESAPPSPLYLRAPDATPPTRLPGQPRPAAPRPSSAKPT